MLRHFAEIGSLAGFANTEIDRIRKRTDDLQESRLARYLQSEPLELVGEVRLPGGLRDLGQKPKCVGERLVLRCSFESMFGCIGTGGGDPKKPFLDSFSLTLKYPLTKKFF